MKDEVLSVLREVVGPLLEADGGQLYLVSVSKSEVHVHLGRSYSGCPGNTLVERRILEPAVQTAAPEASLRVTAGAIIPNGAQPIGPGGVD